jgi:hypothetical protein
MRRDYWRDFEKNDLLPAKVRLKSVSGKNKKREIFNIWRF